MPYERENIRATAGWMDCYRKAFDIIAPVSGEVIAINDAVVQDTAHINAYPYARDGVLTIRVKSVAEYGNLLAFASYSGVIRQLEHA